MEIDLWTSFCAGFMCGVATSGVIIDIWLSKRK